MVSGSVVAVSHLVSNFNVFSGISKRILGVAGIKQEEDEIRMQY